MLLELTTTHEPATDLGFLLAKHPDRCQSFSLAYGRAFVFYPEATEQRCTAALLLDLDPIGLVRGRQSSKHGPGTLDQYVNDRPYVASSFFSVAIAQVFGSAMKGASKDRPELAATPVPLEARISVLPCRGGERFLRRLFEPLGYAVDADRLSLDESFPEWGESPYFLVTLRKTCKLSELLTHLYVLLPVLDDSKHYWVGRDELEHLLARGEGWLPEHPAREEIVERYLKHQRRLTRDALERLMAEDEPDVDGSEDRKRHEEEALEQPISLNEQRIGAVVAALREAGTRRVIDLGCGDGKMLKALLADRDFDRIVGVDVSVRSLEIASARLKLDRQPERQRARIELIQGSLTYRDARFSGFDAACLVEVLEHIEPSRLEAVERTVFEFARPATVVVTTPNAEYNARFENLPAGAFRHRDHRFEWNRHEFKAWCRGVAERHDYRVRFLPVGAIDPEVGAPTQMGIFSR